MNRSEGALIPPVDPVSALLGGSNRDFAKESADKAAAAQKMLDQNVKAIIKGQEALAKQVAASIQQTTEAVTSTVQSIAGAFATSFNQAKGALQGWVQAGISASAAGQVLSFHFEALSRNIAGLFAPEIAKVTELVQRVTEGFRSLSDEQRENIARWLMGAAVGGTVAALLPKLFAGLQMVTTGIKAVSVALMSSGWGAILPILGTAVVALTGFGAASDVAANGINGFLENFTAAFAGVKDSIDGLMTAFQPLMDLGAQVWEKMQPLLVGLVEGAIALATKLAPVIADVLRPMLDLFSQIADTIAPIVGAIAELAATVATAVAPIFGEFVGLVSDLLSFAKPLIDVVVDLGKTLINAILEPIKQIASWISKALAWIRGEVKKLADELGVVLERDKPKVMADLGKKPDKSGGRGELAPRIGGFDQLGAAWERIAQASLMVTMGKVKTTEERHLEVAEQQRDTLTDIHGVLKHQKPAIA